MGSLKEREVLKRMSRSVSRFGRRTCFRAAHRSASAVDSPKSARDSASKMVQSNQGFASHTSRAGSQGASG